MDLPVNYPGLEYNPDEMFPAGMPPLPEEKHNVFTFFQSVASAEDTTKLGFVNDIELGMAKLPIRACKTLALISDKLMDNEFFRDYFNTESEIITSTSLSRNAKLISLPVLQRRELKDMTTQKKVNKGWFRKKEEKPEGEEE